MDWVDPVSERKHPDMWVDPEDDPREHDEVAVGEKAVLAEYLDRYRTTFEMKCGGLTPAQLATRSVPPSSMSLLGLVRHLARVEHHWARRALEGRADLPRLYRSEEDHDLDFNGAVGTDEVVAEAWASWQREVDHAREVHARYDDLGQTIEYDGQPTEVRDIVVHLVEEYARHVGHADLLRECIDGRTGQ
jgi:uncharacterized damage-inducible protein DinB